MKERELNLKILTLGATVLSMLLLGAVVFSFLEEWTLLDSFYFVSMTATTVGYGDFTPTHALSKIITIAYSMSIVPLVLYAFSMVARYQSNSVYRKLRKLEHRQKEESLAVEGELEDTERKVREQKLRIMEARQALREQEKELNRQERKLREEAAINRKQNREIKELEEREGQVEGLLKKTKGRKG